MAEVGPTHPRVRRPDEPQGAAGRQGASRGALRNRADTRRGGFEAKTVRVPGGALQTRELARYLRGVTRGDSRHDRRRPDCSPGAPQGATVWVV